MQISSASGIPSARSRVHDASHDPALPRLIVNCLPLSGRERVSFEQAAPAIAQEFIGDPERRLDLLWRAHIPSDLLGRATAIIGNVEPGELAHAYRLEWLQTWSAGVDRYLVPGVLPPGTVVSTASGAYGQAVAEHMFAMMWALMKNLPAYAVSQHERRWHDAGRAFSPRGATALIVGTGDIGSHFALLAKAVGMNTVGIRRSAGTPADGIDVMHGIGDLDHELHGADVVALCVPSTSLTHHLLDARRLSLMKPSALLLNVGRGGAVDGDALVSALDRGSIRAAGLDVTEPEPLPDDSALWTMPNCLVTPHVAGGNHLPGTADAIISIALRNVRAYAAGEPLSNRQ